MNLTEIQTKCAMVVGAISMLPIDQWAGWVTYILEALEDKAGNRDSFQYEALEEIANTIDDRCTGGQW